MVGAGLTFAGDRFDGSTAAPVAMADYTVVRFFTHYDVNESLRLKVRVENAFDADYEVVRNYPSLPVAVHGGVEWRF
jgi:outer membrane cobalamin receptor